MAADMRPLLKGAWSITENNPSDIFGQSERIDNVNGVVMIEFPIHQGFRSGATAFENAFLGDTRDHVYYQALLQTLCRTATRVRRKITEAQKNNQKVQSAANPIEMFMEVVISDGANPMIEPLQFGSLEETIRQRPFMRNVKDNVDVVAYRIWFFMRYQHAEFDFGAQFFEIINEASVAYDSYRGDRSKQAGDESPEGVSMCSYSGSNETDRFGRSLREHDKWKLLRSRKLLCEVIDLTVGHKQFTKLAALERALDVETPIDDNPANPFYSISPYLYFMYPTDSILEAQSTLKNYKMTHDGQRWSFPRPDLVVRVSPDDQDYDRLSKKLFPDYQVRTIGESLIDEMSRQIRVRASKRYKRSILGEGGAAVVVRNMRHQVLNFGDAGDIDMSMDMDSATLLDGVADPMGDDVVVGANGGGIESSSGVRGGQSISSGKRGQESTLAGRGGFDTDDDEDDRVGSGGPVFVESGHVSGGKNPADIMRMLNSLPAQDSSGNIELYDAAALAREDFEGSASVAAQRLLSSTDLPTKSDFHMVRFMGANLRAQFTDGIVAAERDGCPKSLEEQRRGYLGVQSRIIRDYENKCGTSVSDISPRGKIIIEWFERRRYQDRIKLMPIDEQLWMGIDEPLIDPTLSLFGNMVARRMLRLESSMFVTSAQSIILTLSFGSLDGYRHDFDLHFHVLLTGPNSTGKSFICEKLRDMRIHDTVRKMDESTENAGYIDADINDQIDYCEEIKPAAYKTKAQGGDDTKEAQMKEWLTSMMKIKKVFFKEPNGRRNQRVSASQQITSLIGCTNLVASELSKPMQSRHTIFPVEHVRRRDRKTSHMSGIEKRLDAASQELYENFHDEMCKEQFLHYHVEKMIASAALAEPTLGAFNAINQTFTSYLEDHHNIEVHNRTVQRAGIIARQMTISLACEYLFSCPSSKYWKKSFELSFLRDLDPLLHDTEEIAYCAFDAVRHEILNTKRPLVTRIMKKVYVGPRIQTILDSKDSTDVQTRMRNVYMMPSTKFFSSRYCSDKDVGRKWSGGGGGGGGGGRGGFGGGFNSSSRGNGGKYSKRTMSGNGSGGGGSGGGSSFGDANVDAIDVSVSQVLASDKFSEEYHYAYYRIDGNYDTIADRISSMSSLEETTLDKDTVREVMREMSSKYIVSARYRWDSFNHQPVVDERMPKTKLPALIYAHDCVFVAMAAMTDNDAVNDAISFCQSKKLESERKYVSLHPYDNDHPYLMRTRIVRPEDGRSHRFIDYATQMTEAKLYAYSSLGRLYGKDRPKITSGGRRLTLHYDEMSRRKRCQAIYLDYKDPDACSFSVYEMAMRDRISHSEMRRLGLSARHVLRQHCDYPEQFLRGTAKNMANQLDRDSDDSDDDDDDDDDETMNNSNDAGFDVEQARAPLTTKEASDLARQRREEHERKGNLEGEVARVELEMAEALRETDEKDVEVDKEEEDDDADEVDEEEEEEDEEDEDEEEDDEVEDEEEEEEEESEDDTDEAMRELEQAEREAEQAVREAEQAEREAEEAIREASESASSISDDEDDDEDDNELVTALPSKRQRLDVE